MTVIDLALAERLRIFRDRQGLKLEEVADTLGVSQSTLSRWERGLIEPRRLYLRELANLYEVPFEWLEPDPKAAGNRHNPDNPGYLDNIAGVSFGTSQRLTVISSTPLWVARQQLYAAKRTVGVNHEGWCHLLVNKSAGRDRVHQPDTLLNVPVRFRASIVLHRDHTPPTHRRENVDIDPEVQQVRSAHRSHLRRARPARVPTVR